MAKRVEIEKIAVRGFGTFVDEVFFDMARGGVNIIRGKNGAGKTTLFSALVWALYQVNLKGSLNDAVATWKNMRGKDYKGTRVVVFLRIDDIKYAIARHIKFLGNTYGVPGESDLLLFRENEEGELTRGCLVSDVRGKADTQVLVERLIGVDARTFINSVMFPQRSKRFIEAEPAEKRKLLEELFDLGFVDVMRTNADKKIRALNEEITAISSSVTLKEAKMQGLRDRIEDADAMLKRWEKTRKESLQELREEQVELSREFSEKEKAMKKAAALVAELQPKVGDPEARAKRQRDLTAAFNDALDRMSKAKTHLGDVNREIKRLSDAQVDQELKLKNVKTTCPTCKGPLKADAVALVKTGITQEINRIKAAIQVQEKGKIAAEAAVQERVNAYDEAVTAKEQSGDADHVLVQQYTRAKQEHETLSADLPRLQQRSEKLDAAIKRNQEGVDKPNYDVEAWERDLAGFTNEVAELKTSLSKLTKRHTRYKWWWDIGLSAKGMKAYVFSAMLEQLNGHMEKYAERMGLGVRFSVDLTKTSAPFVTECFKDGSVVDYRDLSGGEKQRIDIAMLFAMHDLVNTIVRFNVLIMDEVFEGLDQEGMEQVFDLIRTKGGKDTTVYVITHSTRVDALQCKKLEVVKKNGQSELQAAA